MSIEAPDWQRINAARRDLDALAIHHPELLGLSSPAQWNQTLKAIHAKSKHRKTRRTLHRPQKGPDK